MERLARDQNSLFVVGRHGLWVIDSRTLKARGQYLKEQDFTGLAESSDGQTLYVVSPTTGITLLDSGNGATRAVISGPVRAPWGIEWASQLTAS